MTKQKLMKKVLLEPASQGRPSRQNARRVTLQVGGQPRDYWMQEFTARNLLAFYAGVVSRNVSTAIYQFPESVLKYELIRKYNGVYEERITLTNRNVR